MTPGHRDNGMDCLAFVLMRLNVGCVLRLIYMRLRNAVCGAASVDNALCEYTD